jgi:hypothetical protein
MKLKILLTFLPAALTAGLAATAAAQLVPQPLQPPAAPIPAAQTGPQPEIYSPEPLGDLGEVLQGEIRNHVFIIGNRGEADLVVHTVNPTCGCTIASVKTPDGALLDPKAHPAGTPFFTLKPGQTAEIQAEFNSANQQPHKLEKTIVVISSDNKQPALQLTMRVDVKKAFVVEPHPLQFGEVNRGTATSLVVWIKLLQGDDMTLTSFRDAPEFFDMKWEKGTAPDGTPGIAVTVSLKANAPTGFVSRQIFAVTDHPKIKEIPITVYCQVRSEVSFDTGNAISRERLDFEVVPQAEERTREITVINGNPAVPYKLTRVDVVSEYKDHIKVETETIEDGVRYAIRVTTMKSLDAKFFRGTLKIVADHPDLKEKAIDFYGWVKRP